MGAGEGGKGRRSGAMGSGWGGRFESGWGQEEDAWAGRALRDPLVAYEERVCSERLSLEKGWKEGCQQMS